MSMSQGREARDRRFTWAASSMPLIDGRSESISAMLGGVTSVNAFRADRPSSKIVVGWPRSESICERHAVRCGSPEAMRTVGADGAVMFIDVLRSKGKAL